MNYAEKMRRFPAPSAPSQPPASPRKINTSAILERSPVFAPLPRLLNLIPLSFQRPAPAPGGGVRYKRQGSVTAARWSVGFTSAPQASSPATGHRSLATRSSSAFSCGCIFPLPRDLAQNQHIIHSRKIPNGITTSAFVELNPLSFQRPTHAHPRGVPTQSPNHANHEIIRQPALRG